MEVHLTLFVVCFISFNNILFWLKGFYIELKNQKDVKCLVYSLKLQMSNESVYIRLKLLLLVLAVCRQGSNEEETRPFPTHIRKNL